MNQKEILENGALTSTERTLAKYCEELENRIEALEKAQKPMEKPTGSGIKCHIKWDTHVECDGVGCPYCSSKEPWEKEDHDFTTSHFGDAVCKKCGKSFTSLLRNLDQNYIETCTPPKPKQKTVGYVNIMLMDGEYILDYPCDKREEAERSYTRNNAYKRVACKRIEIEFEEGEFDE